MGTDVPPIRASAMNQDFIVTFGSNALVLIAQMRQLEAQALRTQQVINQVGATRGGAAGGPAALGGLTAANVGAVSPAVARLTRELGGLQSRMAAVSSLGIAPTLADTRREMALLQQITAAGGPAFGRFNSSTAAAATGLNAINPAAAASAQALRQQRAALDSTSQAFQRHAGRIQETILLYAAFAAVAAGAVSAVSLATTIDTESRRLEAVLALDPAQGREFVSGVFRAGIATATPTEELLSEADLIASAFAGVTDEADRQRLSLELLNRVGQTTTVTQRDVATETQNLIAIMQLGGLTVEGLGVALGQVTAAGNNSSTSISAILDALNIAIPGAKLAGVTIEQLIALTGLFRQETQRSGSEIGNTFKTLFQTITQPEAENNISDITGGLVELRDEAGNLRPALEILLQIRALIDSGAIDPGKLNDIFKAFAPPLNPGAAKDIAIIFDLLDQLPAALREVETTGSSALDSLVEKLNAALGPQFRILVEELKAGFFELFGDDIINSGQTLIDIVRSLGAIIGSLDPNLVRAIGSFIALAVALKGIVFIGGSLLSLLGVRGITTAFAGAGAAAAAAGVSTGIFASAVGSAVVVLGRFLPLLAAWMAIDFAQQVGEQQNALRSQIGGLTEGLDREGLLALRGEIEGQITPKRGSVDTTDLGATNLGLIPARIAAFGADLITGTTVDPALKDGLTEIDRLLALLDERGDGATITLDDLSTGFTEGGAASQEITDAMSAQADELEHLIEGYLNGATASGEMAEAQRLEAETAALLEATRVKQAEDLSTLAERLREGKITAEEFAQGQQLVAQAAELAAQLVALQGGELAKYPLFAAAAAEGNDKLVQKVYDLIVASGGSIGAIGGLIGQLGSLAAANATVADSLANNPLIITIGTRTITLKPGELIRGSTRRGGVGRFGAAANAESEVEAILDSINSLVGGFGTGTAAFGNLPSIGSSGGGGGSSAATRQPGLFDLNEFPADKLAKAIALAQRLQSSIPGANKAAKDEVLNIVKDAQFLKQIKGLDDALLRKAIEQLTDVEKARLEEEKRKNATNEILRNLSVNAGPLGALISAPTLFGVGGSIPAGLNFDPNSGQFVVNVNFGDITGMSEQDLLKKINDVIVNAIRNGLRLQGG